MVDNPTLIPAVSWIMSKYMYKRQLVENYVRKLYFCRSENQNGDTFLDVV